MILGIGNDIIEVSRIKTILERYQSRFLNRVFTEYEQEYCLKKKTPALHLAGRFAAKEAIAKALGVGFSRGLGWLDIEIGHDSMGKPDVSLSLSANHFTKDSHLLVSISHCDQYATAVAVWTKNNG